MRKREQLVGRIFRLYISYKGCVVLRRKTMTEEVPCENFQM